MENFKIVVEKVNNKLIQDLGYSKEHIHLSPDYPRVIVQFWKTLFFIEIKPYPESSNDEKEELINQLNTFAVNYNIAYFGLMRYTVTSEKLEIYKSGVNRATEVKDEQELHISKFIPKIAEIHLNCFQYLKEVHEKDESFTFYLRTDNRRERLEKGYFFLGNDNYCAISFWKGNDWKNKTPNIYIEINMNGEIKLLLAAKDSDKKAKFLSQVAEIVGAKQIKIKGELSPVWIKSYSKNWLGNYLDILKEFVRVDKEIIDAQIFKEKIKSSNNLDGIDFIPVEIFKEHLQRVLPFRNKLTHESINKDLTEKKSPVTLQKVVLQKIAMFESFSMDLSNRVICIIGDNGTGKTTLLRAIVLGLTGVNESTEIDPEDSKYKELQKLLKMSGLDKNGNINYLGNGSVSVEYLMDKKYTNTILLQKEKTSLDIILSDDLYSDGFEALSDSNYFPNLVIAFTQGGREEYYKFDDYEKHRGNIGDISALLFNAKQEHFKELEKWIFDLDGDSATNKRAKQILDFVFEVVTGVIGKRIKIESVEHQREEIWVKIDKNELVLFNLISQGFTRVFAWIGHFIKRLSECNPDMENFKDAPAILIIDEIDTYLHPKWQRNILAFLAETFTNTQFIVTTHSPLVANYLNSEKIKGGVALYRLEKGAHEPKEFKKIYGRDLSAVFFDWMGINERPFEITQKINNLLQKIDEETKESLAEAKILLKELEGLLEPTDEVLVEATALYYLAVENINN